MQKHWSLYNKEDKIRVDDLRADQVKTILLVIPIAKMANWYACREGDLRWELVTELPEFYEDARQLKGDADAQSGAPQGFIKAEAAAPMPPAQKAASGEPRRPLFEEMPTAAMRDSTLITEAETTRERRSAKRFMRKLTFALKHEGQIFKTETLDVSMSGLSLRESLPAGVGKSFKAQLSTADGSMMVLCGRVSDRQLKILDAEAWDVLRHWLMSW